MLGNHDARTPREEAMRLITLARGMLASQGDTLAVTHLDLAFDAIMESQQAEAGSDPSASTVSYGVHG